MGPPRHPHHHHTQPPPDPTPAPPATHATDHDPSATSQPIASHTTRRPVRKPAGLPANTSPGDPGETSPIDTHYRYSAKSTALILPDRAPVTPFTGIRPSGGGGR